MFAKGKYRTRIAKTDADLIMAQQLRAKCFRKEHLDQDTFDPICTHILVEDVKTNDIVCCFRMLPLRNGADISRSYSAQFYELSALNEFDGPMVEMGRFCIDPNLKDPDILRAAWAAMTHYVDDNGIEMLFGCSSFHGTDETSYLDAFAMLKDRHLAPKHWWPRVKAPSVFRFAQKLRLKKPNAKQAMQRMPPLLRTYLMMGGWVSDHAVVDRDLNTLHVFTGVEIRAIPETRKRLLRATAQA